MSGSAIRRIRQAYSRKKIRCSGDKPACAYCRRRGRDCRYEDRMSPLPQESLAERIRALETRMHVLTESLPQHVTVPSSEADAVRRAVDAYFAHCHNQPYALCSEQHFRQRLAQGTLPDPLVLAVAAAAASLEPDVPAATAGGWRDRSWDMLRDDVEQGGGLETAQAVLLHAHMDCADGRVQRGMLRTDIAVRICQRLLLMNEPDAALPAVEREERRRMFWSTYILDKLLSCARDRPPALLDEHCRLRLPRDEHDPQDTCSDMPLLRQMNATDSPALESAFGLAVGVTSILAACFQQMRLDEPESHTLPGRCAHVSDFAATQSRLLLFEVNHGPGEDFRQLLRSRAFGPDGAVDARRAGHIVYTYATFGLCYLLLNHPLVLRRNLDAGGKPLKAGFLQRRLHTCTTTSLYLVGIFRDAQDLGVSLRSPFYSYCLTVAAGLLVLQIQAGSHSQHAQLLADLAFCQGLLRDMSGYWACARHMVRPLRLSTLPPNSSMQFNSINNVQANSSQYARILDPSQPYDFNSLNRLCSFLDYGFLMSSDFSLPTISLEERSSILLQQVNTTGTPTDEIEVPPDTSVFGFGMDNFTIENFTF
ncbi:hypothetical protein SLS56_012073 [Neofusicoccum ribis]|uniref:Xylanolytic transcriptional activator regulatory domain-containing protein n=1 Tax=Neofusicoccum ribis TaxID=45134 RepID=A0ABR3S9V8_9PEZI